MGSGQVFDFGLRLRKLRENKHLSQEELGKRVGVTKGSIYRYESWRWYWGQHWTIWPVWKMESSSGFPICPKQKKLPCVSLSVDSFPETLTTDLCGCVFGRREQRPGSRN